jgi:hypothetical protein
MIHAVLVAVGAAAGCLGFVVAWQLGWNRRQVLQGNVAVCAVAGVVAGVLVFAAQQNVGSSLLSYGLLGTAAPFASALLPLPKSPPRNVSEAWGLMRRTAASLALNTLLGASATSATYILIVGGVLFTRGTN